MMTPTNPTTPRPTGEHWRELAATLSPERTDELSRWMESELQTLELQLAAYVTGDSLRRSQRREIQSGRESSSQ
jgi:hypothetical protein